MDKDKNIKVALGQTLDSKSYTFVDFSEFVIKNQDSQDCMDPSENDPISLPHSNSFLDLDGDCMPDIFLTKLSENNGTFSPYYEIYSQRIFKGKTKYCLIQSNQFLTEDQQFSSLDEVDIPLVSFADIDLNGMTDMVFYHQKKVYTIYNQLISKNYKDNELSDE